MVERIKGHRHLKPGILPDCGRHIDGFHLLAHLHECGSGFFFIRIYFIPNFHQKLFFICRKVCFCGLNVSPHTAYTFFQDSDLLRVMLGDIVLKSVFLAGVVSFHQLQLGYLNIEIHLFFYIGIARCQSLNFRIS